MTKEMNSTRIYEELVDYLQILKSGVVAFSGGVDSSLLLYAANQAMGEGALGITVHTPYIPTADLAEAVQFTEKYAIRHEIYQVKTPPTILHNPPDRCYLCKKDLFSAIIHQAEQAGIETVLEGSNRDDLRDYRPGLKALEELHIVSPYLLLNINKQQIREMAKNLELSVWNKPSNACLLSRIEYHTEINDTILERVAKADQVLQDLELAGSRVRSHGDIARVEIPIDRFKDIISSEIRVVLIDKLKSCGYSYVTLDLEGYKTGSMNRKLI